MVPFVVLVLLSTFRLAEGAADAGEVRQIGTIRASAIRESSGVAPCKYDPQIFWTETDGRKPILFAIDRQGRSHGQTVIDVALTDWEDLSTDHAGHLYIADTGNNDGLRHQIAVHEIDEPDPKSMPARIPVKRSWILEYPKEPFDCESLFIWKGRGYMISKVFNNAKASVYSFPLTPSQKPVVLEKLAKLKVDSPVTSAALSSDGRKLAILTKSGPGILQMGDDWTAAWQEKPAWTKFKHEHVEACCFVPEGLLVTAESREIYLFTAPVFKISAPSIAPR